MNYEFTICLLKSLFKNNYFGRQIVLETSNYKSKIFNNVGNLYFKLFPLQIQNTAKKEQEF
jgi:hypothetical protein